MSLIVSGEKKSAFPPLEAGPHIGRCVQLIDLGKQRTSFQGQEKITPQVMLVFELPNDRIEIEGKDVPRTCTVTYTGGESGLSERANLRKSLESWRGKPFTEEELKGFDLRNVVNKPCTITITPKVNAEGKAYSVVSAITSAMKGVVTPEAETPIYVFDFDDPNWASVLENLPEWQRKKVEAGVTYEERVAEAQTPTVPDDVFADSVNKEDLPF